MWVDIICLAFYVIGIYKGFKKGLLAAILTLLGYIIALIIAVILGDKLARFITELSGTSGYGITIVSFLILFIGVILIVSQLIFWLDKGLDIVMLGLFNKLGGVIFYVALYSLILMILFYWISYLPFFVKEYFINSFSYELLHDKMPLMVSFLGILWPTLKAALADMEQLLH
jgi:membrane protein required for colicin V production